MHWGVFTSSLLGKIAGAVFLAIAGLFGFGPDQVVGWLVSGLPISPASARLIIALLAAFAVLCFVWPHLRSFLAKRTGGKGLMASLLISAGIFCLFGGAMVAINQLDGRVVSGAAGEWRGNKFIYNEPRLIRTFTVGPEDDGQFFRFHVSGVDSGSFVMFKVEYDEGHGKGLIVIHENQEVNWKQVTRKTQSGVQLRSDNTTVLKVHVPGPSDMTIIRVYALWWRPKPDGTR